MQNLQWIKDGNRYLLKNGEEVMVDLTHSLTGKSIFSVNNNQYGINCTGFWSPKYEVEHNGKRVLQFIPGIWKSTGKIIFSDGSEYQADYQSKNGLKLRFLDNGNEILVYGIDYSNRKKIGTSFYLGIAMEDAEKLLILAALGMSVFSSLTGEMSDGDFVLLVV